MGKVSSSDQAQGIQYPPPNPAGRDPLREQTLLAKPKEVLVKTVPITEIPIKAVPMNMSEKAMPYR